MTKPLCERAPRADVRELKRRGIVGNSTMTIVIDGVRVEISHTPCFLGGARPYFLCPECDRRAAILYNRRYWACRNCHGLAHASENATTADRRRRKIFKARARLNQCNHTQGLLAPFPAKPKWMRWHTYLRARQCALALEQSHYSALKVAFNL